ncbi:MAG: hypothetical protein ACT4N8_01615 [Sphingosinicella sp.]|uniref:hypothetical protein n=1 Tax=Sphingosinicella sp. TaxID=1917971 RepID=UPI0040383A80
MGFKALFIAAAGMFLGAQDIDSQPVPQAGALTYADLADLALAAPIAAHVRIRDADRLSREQAASAPPGHRRYLVEAEIVALIRGAGGLPERVRYLVDLPDDSASRPRRRSEWLILAQRPAGQPAGELRLAAPDAQLPYTSDTAERLREILREANQPGAPPRITGIGRAFHVPGSLSGESETQIFLQTADNRPISLTILRRPNETPRWSVALSEIVDEAAAAPERDTLLWYRLACTLPPALPRESTREASADEARAIAADYRLVREGLGSCGRNRQPR